MLRSFLALKTYVRGEKTRGGSDMQARLRMFPIRFAGSMTLRPRMGLDSQRRSILSVGFAVALLGMAAQPSLAQNLPPGVTEIDVTNDLTHRWGEPEVAVNPK